MIMQNYLLILRDLDKARQDSEDDEAEVPVVISLKITGAGNKVLILPSIEWKLTKKNSDSMDQITLDPNQIEMKL
jgi:hypothetical protein